MTAQNMEQTHAQLAAALMRQASKFFLSIGQQNPELNEQMSHNAQTFSQVADLVEADPTGKVQFKEDEGN